MTVTKGTEKWNIAIRITVLVSLWPADRLADRSDGIVCLPVWPISISISDRTGLFMNRIVIVLLYEKNSNTMFKQENLILVERCN